jgi:hypothetical protein
MAFEIIAKIVESALQGLYRAGCQGAKRIAGTETLGMEGELI